MKKKSNVVPIDEARIEASKKLDKVKAVVTALIILIFIFLGYIFRGYFTVENARLLLSQVNGFLKGEGSSYTQREIKVVSSDKNNYNLYKDNFIVHSTDGVYMYAPDGSEKFFNKNMVNPISKSSEKYLMFYDFNGRTAGFISYTTLVKEMTFSGDIITAATNDSGYSAVAYTAAGYKGIVSVFNKDFDEIFKYSSDANIISLDVSSAEKTMCVALCDTSGNKMESFLKIWAFDEREPSASVSLGDCLIFDVGYMKNSNICVVTEKGISVFTNSGKKLGGYDFGTKVKNERLSLYSLDGSDAGAFILNFGASYKKSDLLLIDFEGNVAKRVYVGEEISSISAGDYIVAASAKQAYIYDKSGEFIRKSESSFDIKDVVLDKNGAFYIVGAKDILYESVK